MSNINAVNASQSNWPAASSKESSANAEIQKLTEDIEKEENELKRINQEFSKYLSDGAQDKAKLKSMEMTQKQMQIQSMQLQISRLEKSEKDSEAVNPAIKDNTDFGRPNFDRYIKSDEQPEETPGIYRLEKDENGNQKVVFDRSDSERTDALADIAPEEAQILKSPDDALKPDVDAMLSEKPEKENESQKPGDKKSGMYCRVNTDRVDAEIKKLKAQKQQAQQELNRVRDNEERRKEVEQRLTQIETKLSAKDNDAYRKTNASFTYSSTPL